MQVQYLLQRIKIQKLEILITKGVSVMQEENIERRKYKKKNDFKINIIFNKNGENLETIIERAFSNYILRNNGTNQ